MLNRFGGEGGVRGGETLRTKEVCRRMRLTKLSARIRPLLSAEEWITLNF
jgi:hypothetical protein